MKYILIIPLLIFCIQSSFSLENKDIKESRVSDRIFNSAIDAAVYSSYYYNDESVANNIEYLGAILSNQKGLYYFTVSKGDRHKHHVSARITIPEGHKLAAFWHTHGKGTTLSRYFSPFDTNIANTYRVPIYMISSSNVLRVFNPGDTVFTERVSKWAGFKGKGGVAEGTIIRNNYNE